MAVATKVETTTIEAPMRTIETFNENSQGSSRCPAVFDRKDHQKRIL